MKALAHTIVLITLVILSTEISEAQKAIYTTNGGMTIGFGIGGAYQKSDIANSIGGGFDFWLGHHIAKRENAFFGYDWRFRFLAGENMAHDHRINNDGTYSNINYKFFNYDLELGLTLNRLRERTRIVLSGFAGGGITHGRTFTDLYDQSGTLYDYSAIDPNQIRAQVNADLLELSDGEYETKLVNKAAILPTVGLFLGYQFSPSFALGIEHKTNISMTEANSTFGINIDNRALTDSPRDRNNYTSLVFRWSMGSGSGISRTRRVYTPVSTIPATQTTPVTRVRPDRPVTVQRPVSLPPPPVVRITSPSANPHNTTSATINITARIQNVSSRQNIQVLLNGNNINFEFSQSTGTLRTNLSLAEGRNSLAISAANETGSARDNLTINHNRTIRQPVAALPGVKFINPASPVTVDNNIFQLRARTENVKAWQDVSLMVNGTRFTNFSLTPDGHIATNIGLNEGVNRIEITVKNEAGTANDKTTITYAKPSAKPVVPPVVPPVVTPPPAVSITIPGTSPYNTTDLTQNLQATVTGVTGRDNITVTLNGRSFGNFTYDNNTRILRLNVQLAEGRNVVTITATSEAGKGTASQIIQKETKPCPVPVIRIVEPSGNVTTTENQTLRLRISTGNITGKSQLTLTLNKRNITEFSFSGNELTYNAILAEGLNTFIVSAENECGRESVTLTVTYKPKQVVVPVEKPCGIRINPGNADWQFCLITPSGTFNRASLTNKNFSYSGPASSLYFMPTAGGGEATVKGAPYTVRSGQYYLFTGNIKVTVSTNNPGSMGQWSVCIEADRPPTSGIGNNRPKSPCEKIGENENENGTDRQYEMLNVAGCFFHLNLQALK